MSSPNFTFVQGNGREDDGMLSSSVDVRSNARVVKFDNQQKVFSLPSFFNTDSTGFLQQMGKPTSDELKKMEV